MAWRAQGVTGSNNIPLGNRRRFGGERDSSADDGAGGYNPLQPTAGMDYSSKRGRSPIRRKSPAVPV